MGKLLTYIYSEMRDLSEDNADAVWLESGLAELDLCGPPSALLALPGGKTPPSSSSILNKS